MRARILFYDDNEPLRQSLGELLNVEADMEFIAGFANAESVETDISVLKPDVILMDIDMPSIDGVEAVRRVRKIRPDLPIIMLTVFDDNENIFNAICAGASGYILKRYALSEVAGAIRNVLTGGAPMTGVVAKKVLQMVPPTRDETKKNEVGLTKKEIIILDLMTKGYSYKMIAAELGNSHDTIRHHIKHIYDKLHVHSATQAVSKAIKDRLV
ncbi:MAG TPA: response regulator transcription factor [Chitinophagaceae bacterium]